MKEQQEGNTTVYDRLKVLVIKYKLFLLILIGIILIFAVIPLIIAGGVSSTLFDKVKGDANGWLGFWGGYIGGTGGAIIAGYIALNVAMAQIKKQADISMEHIRLQMELEDKRQREFLLIEMRIQKVQEMRLILKDIYKNYNEILGKLNVLEYLFSNKKITRDLYEEIKQEFEKYESKIKDLNVLKPYVSFSLEEGLLEKGLLIEEKSNYLLSWNSKLFVEIVNIGLLTAEIEEEKEYKIIKEDIDVITQEISESLATIDRTIDNLLEDYLLKLNY